MIKHKIFSTIFLSAIVSMGLFSCIKEEDNPSVGTPGELVSLQNLRLAYQGGEVSLGSDNLNGASKIEGVVISDKDGKNLDPNSFVLQQTEISANSFTDVTRGIVIRMNSVPAYNIGDSLQIIVTGAKLSRNKGALTLSSIGPEKITVLATGKVPLSRAVTQGVLHAKMEEYESTLVTLHADAASAGSPFSGVQALNDNTGATVYTHTLSTADNASAILPVNAQFGGIASFFNESGNDTSGAKKVIMPRNATDIKFASGALYAGWPESFESPDVSAKSSYNSGTNIIALGTGNWYLLQAILANTAGSDRYNIPGKQGVRMQQNLTTSGYVQMNFDVPDGASKVTVFYGRYSNDAKSSLRLEASTNAGSTWTIIGTPIVNEADKLFKQATWMVNYTGPVRFRVTKIGTGTSNNGRMNLDDFAIYKK